MIPGQIAVDPAFPDSNIKFGPPPGAEDWCGELHVRLTCLQSPDGTIGPAGFLSEWYPTPEELALLNEGQPVRTHIVARALPPQAVWVRNRDEI